MCWPWPQAGAAYAGFVFFAKIAAQSDAGPRRATLRWLRPPGWQRWRWSVDADDAALDAIVDAVPLDMLQLHGHETPGAGGGRCGRAMACR